jgi:hypothetical protein
VGTELGAMTGAEVGHSVVRGFRERAEFSLITLEVPEVEQVLCTPLTCGPLLRGARHPRLSWSKCLGGRRLERFLPSLPCMHVLAFPPINGNRTFVSAALLLQHQCFGLTCPPHP